MLLLLVQILREQKITKRFKLIRLCFLPVVVGVVVESVVDVVDIVVDVVGIVVVVAVAENKVIFN